MDTIRVIVDVVALAAAVYAVFYAKRSRARMRRSGLDASQYAARAVAAEKLAIAAADRAANDLSAVKRLTGHQA